VTAFNEDLEDAPEAVNNDPYGDGWLIKITIDDASEVDGLLSAAEYADMVGK
jgi:glycine cleavage system H protein